MGYSFLRAGSTVMIVFLLLAAVVMETNAGRPKESDEHGEKLIPFAYLGGSCATTHFDYAVVGDSVEVCNKYYALGGRLSGEYEQLKCEKLRVHGAMVGKRCKCEDENWSGPLCHYRRGCPDKYSYRDGVCTANLCANNGTLAIGSKRVECRCPLPWDGRWCERLACWRMADHASTEHRWRNSVNKCECDDGYSGKKCEKVTQCRNGQLVGGHCYCKVNYTGDFCDQKCGPHTNVSCSGCLLQTSLPVVLFLIFITMRANHNE